MTGDRFAGLSAGLGALDQEARAERRRRFMAFDPLELPEYRRLTLGDGKIGGKAKGLLYAREALRADTRPEAGRVSVPASRFLATGIYHEFLARNGLEAVDEGGTATGGVEEAFLAGSFPPAVTRVLREVVDDMDYPLAVRSSAVLEDSLRYSFAGKYLTLFIPNRGPVETRAARLEEAIKRVYASTFGPNAVTYRKKHGLPREEMAVIIQELQGRDRGGLFYPELSGVGFSRNFRRWTERVRMEDGVVRIVFGLGTRCTGRGYARNFSLTDPSLRPEGNVPREIGKYSQEVVDALDLDTGRAVSFNINTRLGQIEYHPDFPIYAQIYSATEDAVVDAWSRPTQLRAGEKYVFTFHHLERFYPEVFHLTRYVFRLLEEAMGVSTDIEFVHKPRDRGYILLQARPLSSWEEYRVVRLPADIDPDRVLLRGDRMLTNGELRNLRYLVYVDFWHYRRSRDKYAVAREVGRLNRLLAGERYVLVGPGRWGSSSPQYGVPVNYSEISSCGVLVEVGIRAEDFVPELSYGTHFFADLDVDGVLYLPVFDTEPTNVFNRQWFDTAVSLPTEHPAVKLFPGCFHAYLDGRNMEGVIIRGDSGR